MKLVATALLALAAIAPTTTAEDLDCIGLSNVDCAGTDGCMWTATGICVEEHHSFHDVCSERSNKDCEADDMCLFFKGKCEEANRGSGVQFDACNATFQEVSPNSGEFATVEVEGEGCSAGYGCLIEDTAVAAEGVLVSGTCQPTQCFGKKVPGNCNGGNADNEQCSEATIRVTICHRTCSETNPWVRITIDDDAWDDNKDDTCGHQQHTIDPTCNGKDLSKWGVNKSDYLIKRHGTRAEIAASVPNEKAYWRQWERACPYVLNDKCCSWDPEDDNLCCGDPPGTEVVPETSTSAPTTPPGVETLPPAPTPAPVPESATNPPSIVPVPDPTPAPVVVAATPAPVVVAATPAPVVVAATPAPVVVAATPAPVVVAATPAPVVVAATPAPVAPVTAPTPAPAIIETNMPAPITPAPVASTASPVGLETLPPAPTPAPIPESATTPPSTVPDATPAPVVVAATPPPQPEGCPPELYAINGVRVEGGAGNAADYPITIVGSDTATVTFEVCVSTGSVYTGFLETENGEYVCYETQSTEQCTTYTATCFDTKPISVVDLHYIVPLNEDLATTPVPQCCQSPDPLSAAYVFVLPCDCPVIA